MKVCVFGLWHLGSVTAACLASGGHSVIGLDFNEEVIANLSQGHPPLFEPGLEELIQSGIEAKRLAFTTETDEALRDADILWVTYDTPVDEDDQADIEYVANRVIRLFPYLRPNTLVLISSQLPVGSTKKLELAYSAQFPDKQVSFGYSPENLRLGKAISVFTQPDRVVVGVRTQADQERAAALLGPFTDRIEWMSVESAEMTKHALNAFLAASVAFANEIAVLCERVGADAKEVERGLKSESRIGPKAYLGPGAAFAGGTLARDIAFLTQLGRETQQPVPLLAAVKTSNDNHKLWVRQKLEEMLGPVSGRKIAVWGLTYKPGTDTLRRSSAVELCTWLLEQGAQVRAHDPAVKSLPDDLKFAIELCPEALEAIDQVAALVIATEWPEYKDIDPHVAVVRMQTLNVIDPNRFLARTFGSDPRFRYAAVGKALS
jgi:UDPglucose 6-dehydrogenase